MSKLSTATGTDAALDDALAGGMLNCPLQLYDTNSLINSSKEPRNL
jgi:hypothetical protein